MIRPPGMKRFAVVVFSTVCPLYAGRAQQKGGGVCFLSDERRADWPAIVSRIAGENLIWDVGRSVEIGVATLDEALLEAHCHKLDEGVYWQGGDEA